MLAVLKCRVYCDHGYMDPAYQLEVMQSYGPGMPGLDEPYADWRKRVREMTSAEREEYEDSGRRQLELVIQKQRQDRDKHADSVMLKRKDRTNARDLTRLASQYQNELDRWAIQNECFEPRMNPEEALASAQKNMQYAKARAPLSVMTPDVLFRRQMGDQAKVAKRKPAAKKHRKVARPRHGTPNCVLGAMC